MFEYSNSNIRIKENVFEKILIEKPIPNENEIPSSVSRWNNNYLSYKSFFLTNNVKWVHNIKVPFNMNFQNVINKVEEEQKNKIFLVGSSPRNNNLFEIKTYQQVRIGKEAVLDLNENHFSKSSLKELIRRGFKNGYVKEIEFSVESKTALHKFKKDCAHGREPQLKYFFHTEFNSHNRLFVFKDFLGKWLGAILLSIKDKNYIQTELILRYKNAPNGIMEALIYSIFEQLKKENFKKWTLGAVPFTIFDSKILSKEFIINLSGRLLKFGYNYKGLFHFKNKFNPHWVDYYIICKEKLTLPIMFNVMLKSNLLSLIIFKFVINLKDFFTT